MTDLERASPRPLAAHLGAGASDLAQALALAFGADDPRFPWRPSLRAEGRAWAEQAAALDRDALGQALTRHGLDELRAALAGVERLTAVSSVRRPKAARVVATFGAATLYDFGGPADGAPLLALPSLVNTWRVLDLTRSRSFMRGLADRGVRPFLLDWGDPGLEERGFSIADYVERRASPALETVASTLGRRTVVLGHCMAGGAAAATAAMRPDAVAGLALLAAPWDFRPFRPTRAAPSKGELTRLIDACGAIFGGVPSDVLNMLFFLRDPLQAMRKFPSFGRRTSRGPKDRLFIAVEDWLADGLRLAAPAARTLFVDWGHDNALARGAWRVAGRSVRLRDVRAPIVVVASKADTVAPHAGVVAAHAARPDATLIAPRAGHVGMIVGSRAEAELWDPLAAWCRDPV